MFTLTTFSGKLASSATCIPKLWSEIPSIGQRLRSLMDEVGMAAYQAQPCIVTLYHDHGYYCHSALHVQQHANFLHAKVVDPAQLVHENVWQINRMHESWSQYVFITICQMMLGYCKRYSLRNGPGQAETIVCRGT